MTAELFIYMLKMNLIFSAMYLAYRLFMQRTVFHQWNRIYLLIAPLVAIAHPLIGSQNVDASIYIVELPPLAVGNGTERAAGSLFSIWTALGIVWLTGVLIASLTMINNIKLSYDAIKSKNGSAFTFLRKIHIDPLIEDNVRRKIAVHEQVHADQLHTLDLLWYELLRVVFWFNPFYLLGRRSLKIVHEYIADNEANKVAEDYSETLLANAFGLSVLPLSNEFNSNNIKNRIVMITKKKSAGQRIALFGSVLLVAFASISIGWTAIVVPNDVGKEEVYEVVEKMPLFPGCDESEMKGEELKKCSMNMLFNFFSATVKYPEKAQKENAEGMVMVKFIVMKDGSIEKAQVVKSVSKELDAEALRVISTMPNWVPGEQKGEKVMVAMVLPIKFLLE